MTRFGIIAALLALAGQATAKDYPLNGGCLSIDATRPDPFYNPYRPTTLGSPFLRIPAPFPTPELTDAEDRTGIGVFYMPISNRQFTDRLKRRHAARPGDCVETPFAHDLARITQDPNHTPKSTDPLLCAASDTKIDLAPADKSIPLRLRCPGDLQTGACWGSFYVTEEWEARFLISPADLPQWRRVVGLVDAFFKDDVHLCTP